MYFQCINVDDNEDVKDDVDDDGMNPHEEHRGGMMSSNDDIAYDHGLSECAASFSSEGDMVIDNIRSLNHRNGSVDLESIMCSGEEVQTSYVPNDILFLNSFSRTIMCSTVTTL